MRASGLDLGRFGVWTFDFEFQPAAQMRTSIQELEEQGWRAFWIPELFGREALTHASYLQLLARVATPSSSASRRSRPFLSRRA